jgi:aminoglycoside phosphotransferase (APT) family kinase protein
MWPGKGVVVTAFPNDRKLKAIRRLADAHSLGRVLARLDPAQDPSGAALGVMAYKPERRLVARVDIDGRPWAILRVYTESAYETARRNALAFQSTGRLRVARPLGRSTWQQTLGMEFLQGRTLDSVITASAYPGPQVVAPVAEALAQLHAQTAAAVRATDPSKRASTIADLAAWVAFICPDLSERANRLAADLANELATPAAETGVMHGDFYASQVLLDADPDGRVGLLDMDEACAGEPSADLGNFAAHLASDAIRGHVPPDRVGPLIRTLNASYSSASATPLSPRITLHTAAALFRLSPHPFRRREKGWPELTRRIVGRAEEMLRVYRGSRQ